MKSKINGITLIALVVTIIMMLILAGVTINSMINKNEIIKKTLSASNKFKIAQEDEEDAISNITHQFDQYENSINNQYEFLSDKVTDGTIKIGDYIKYSPDENNISDETKSKLQNYSGYTGVSYIADYPMEQENLNWRVVDIVDGKVRIISDKSTSNKILLYGANGYNNGVYLTNKVCNELYSNKKYGEAKNLNKRDVEKFLNYDYTVYENYEKTMTSNINPTYYPNIIKKEKEFNIGGISSSGELNKEEQNEIYNGISSTDGIFTSKIDYYSIKIENEVTNIKENIYYELFFNSQNSYWLSSRCNIYFDGYIGFCIDGILNDNTMVPYGTIWTHNIEYYGEAKSLKPIVTLNTDVKVNTNSNQQDGSNPEKAWILNV